MYLDKLIKTVKIKNIFLVYFETIIIKNDS